MTGAHAVRLLLATALLALGEDVPSPAPLRRLPPSSTPSPPRRRRTDMGGGMNRNPPPPTPSPRPSPVTPKPTPMPKVDASTFTKSPTPAVTVPEARRRRGSDDDMAAGTTGTTADPRRRRVDYSASPVMNDPRRRRHSTAKASRPTPRPTPRPDAAGHGDDYDMAPPAPAPQTAAPPRRRSQEPPDEIPEPAAGVVRHKVNGAEGYWLPATIADITAAPGDELEFAWSRGYHDVMELETQEDFDACAKDGVVLKDGAESGTYIHVLTEGTHFFVCSVGDHCERGQKVKVTVAEGGSPVPIIVGVAAGVLVAGLGARVMCSSAAEPPPQDNKLGNNMQGNNLNNANVKGNGNNRPTNARTRQPGPRTMAVQVPPGVVGGQPIQVQTPAGLMEVLVPPHLGPGDTFQFQFQSVEGNNRPGNNRTRPGKEKDPLFLRV